MDRSANEAGTVTFNKLDTSSTAPPETPTPVPSPAPQPLWTAMDGTPFILINVVVDGVIREPGHYTLTATHRGRTDDIGAIDFHYQPTPSLTPDQVKAVEADVTAAKVIRLELGCKFCPTKMTVYTGLKRNPSAEKNGAVWYADAPDEFVCQCQRTRIPLRYIRESMHGLLLKDFSLASSGLSYVRQYGHAQAAAIAERFKALLNTEELEPPIQAFLEAHPILLARFHAKRLFVKPNIVGRFQADFAILDSQQELWFIEIERPSLRLFKKNGHPTAVLMHAYGQVNDWLDQYRRYPGAIQEALNLRADEIVAVRAAIIAGRSGAVTHEVLQRHYAAPPYPSIEFLTFDDLSSSLVTLSRKLA